MAFHWTCGFTGFGSVGGAERWALWYTSVFDVGKTLRDDKSSGEIGKIVKLPGSSPAEIDKIVQQWRASRRSGIIPKIRRVTGMRFGSSRDAADINLCCVRAVDATLKCWSWESIQPWVISVGKKRKLRNCMSLQIHLECPMWSEVVWGSFCYKLKLPDKWLSSLCAKKLQNIKSFHSWSCQSGFWTKWWRTTLYQPKNKIIF